jgi:hypothetical protein
MMYPMLSELECPMKRCAVLHISPLSTHLSFKYREKIILRHILKHLRERRLLSSYNDILSQAKIQIEHPLVTELHTSLVRHGDWSKAETLLQSIASASLFASFLDSCQPHSVWKRLLGTDRDGDVPSARGGHAMCIDHENSLLYVFGGWNGERSLDDFWVYDINGGTWRAISHATSEEKNAPGPRSCHKMVFDAKTGNIYFLGMLNERAGLSSDPPQPPSTSSPVEESTNSKGSSCEFYRYHTRGPDEGKWQNLSSDKKVPFTVVLCFFCISTSFSSPEGWSSAHL